MGDYFDFAVIGGSVRAWVAEADGSAREWVLTPRQSAAFLEMLELHERAVQRALRESL